MSTRRSGNSPFPEIARFVRAMKSAEGVAESALHGIYARLIASSYAGDRVDVHVGRYMRGTGYPDLTVSRAGVCLNWFEIKRPNVSVDPLPPLDQTRFNRYLKTLPHVVVTNGRSWLMFKNNELVVSLDLPRDWLSSSRCLPQNDVVALHVFLKTCADLPRTNIPSVAGTQRVVLYMRPELARRLFIRSAEDDRTLSDIGTEAIEHWIRNLCP